MDDSYSVSDILSDSCGINSAVYLCGLEADDPRILKSLQFMNYTAGGFSSQCDLDAPETKDPQGPEVLKFEYYTAVG